VVAVWPALGVAVAGIVVGIAVAVVRGLRAWRGFKALGRGAGERLEAISRKTEEIDTHLTRAGASSERLSESLAKLRQSRARLDVQLAAVREARASIERLLPFGGG
jgi:hypothetical protein